MAENLYDSENTELYLSFDGTTSTEFDCPTGINGMGFTASERDSSCLNESISVSKPGKRKLNAFTVPFRVSKGSTAHQALFALSEDDQPSVEIPYAVAWSDGTVAPVLAAGVYGAPGTGPAWTRTVTVGSMYVSGVSFDFADGQDVMGSFTAMPQSQQTVWKPAP